MIAMIVKRPVGKDQGNRIWISQAQIAGREVDFGGIGQIGDAENRYFEGHVRAN
jgi:hypothetical protein